MWQIMNIPYLLFGMTGGWEWVIIFLVILLLFGAKRLPELAKGLGKGIREFKGALEGVEKELEEPGTDEDKKPDEEKASGD